MTSTITVDGRTTAYLEAGTGPGRPLLLVHGYTGGKDDFAGVLDELAASRRVVAVDLPGHGGSAPPENPAEYGLGPIAAWLLRLADALELGEHHLLGHSHGGLVVQRVAAAASHRLASLILMDTGMGALREEAADHAVAMALAARDEGLQAAWDVARKRPPPPLVRPPDPERDARFQARFFALSPDAFVGGARNLTQSAPLGAFLRGIDIPVLVLHGEHDDVWLPSEQALLARTVARARYAVIPDAAHSPQVENPKHWLGEVTQFLAEVEP